MKRLSQGLVWVAAAFLLALVIVRSLGSADAPKRPEATGSQTPLAIEAASVAAGRTQNPKPVAETAPADSSTKPHIVTRRWTARKHFRTASDAISALLPAAQAGDTKAMIGIALALDECRLEPPSPKEIEFGRVLGARSGSPIDEDEEARIQRYTASFNRYCTLSHEEVFSQYRFWLLKAADSGDSEAQLLASLVPPFDEHYKDKMMQAAKRADGSRFDLLGGDARTLSIKYAHMAMEQGEVWGVMQLRSLENSDEPEEKNPVDFYLYNWLMTRIPKSDGSYGSWDKSLEWAGKPLRLIDREIAVERGQAILAKTREWIWRPNPVELFIDRDVVLDP